MSDWINEMQQAQAVRDSQELKELLEVKKNVEKLMLSVDLLTVLVKDLKDELAKDN